LCRTSVRKDYVVVAAYEEALAMVARE